MIETAWLPKARDALRRGFTLIEVMFTVGILAVALVGLVSALLSSMRLRQLNAEKATARNAAEQALSAMRGMANIPEAYARFGRGGTEETFEVYGLPAPAAGQAVGRVIVWRNKSGNPPDSATSTVPALTAAEIQEAQGRFGMPFPLTLIGTEGPLATEFLDVNADGAVTAADSPSLMPVTVRIRWRSRSGVITEYFSTVLGRR